MKKLKKIKKLQFGEMNGNSKKRFFTVQKSARHAALEMEEKENAQTSAQKEILEEESANINDLKLFLSARLIKYVNQ